MCWPWSGAGVVPRYVRQSSAELETRDFVFFISSQSNYDCSRAKTFDTPTCLYSITIWRFQYIDLSSMIRVTVWLISRILWRSKRLTIFVESSNFRVPATTRIDRLFLIRCDQFVFPICDKYVVAKFLCATPTRELWQRDYVWISEYTWRSCLCCFISFLLVLSLLFDVDLWENCEPNRATW